MIGQLIMESKNSKLQLMSTVVIAVALASSAAVTSATTVVAEVEIAEAEVEAEAVAETSAVMWVVFSPICEAWWSIGRVDAFRPKDHGFESRSIRHVGTLGKSFTHRCLWRFGVKLRHSIRAVSGAPLSSSGLERRYIIA